MVQSLETPQSYRDGAICGVQQMPEQLRRDPFGEPFGVRAQSGQKQDRTSNH